MKATHTKSCPPSLLSCVVILHCKRLELWTVLCTTVTQSGRLAVHVHDQALGAVIHVRPLKRSSKLLRIGRRSAEALANVDVLPGKPGKKKYEIEPMI